VLRSLNVSTQGHLCLCPVLPHHLLVRGLLSNRPEQFPMPASRQQSWKRRTWPRRHHYNWKGPSKRNWSRLVTCYT